MWIIFALAAAIIWGINYSASGRVLARGVSPGTLFLLDCVFGALVVGGLLTLTGKAGRVLSEIRSLGGDAFWLVVAMVCSTAAAMLIFMAIEEKNATVASLIEISYPLFVALFAWLLFREVQLNWPTAVGGVLILAGVFIVWKNNS